MTNSENAPRVVFGLALIVVGGLFLAANLTDFDFSLADWWPGAIIAIGLVSVLQGSASRLWGFGSIIVGAALLLNTLDIVSWDIGQYWPVLLLIIGVLIILGGMLHRRGVAASADASGISENPDLDISCVFGGSEQQVTSQNFRGGRISATFGGANIDMRRAALANGEAVLNVSTLFGGVEFHVPNDWAVNVQTSNMFGGANDKRVKPADPKERLTITGSCTFGGITITS